MKKRRHAFDVWCKCRRCGDTLTLTLWLRGRQDGKFLATLEPSSAAFSDAGLLFHRKGVCDGVLQVFDLPGPTILED